MPGRLSSRERVEVGRLHDLVSGARHADRPQHAADP